MNNHTSARLSKTLAFVAALAFFLVTPFNPAPWVESVAAQGTQLTTTFLNAAVADGQVTTLQVASATGITAPGTGANLVYLYVDLELMEVRAVNSTNITVLRGANGTQATPHALNSLVYIGGPNQFTSVDYAGTCVAANQSALPVINVRNGNIWNCATTLGTVAQWQGFNPLRTFEIAPRVPVAGTAYTILPTDTIVALSTAIGSQVAVKSFTLPDHRGLAGKILLVKDESGGLTATTQIVLIGTIDGTASSVATVIALKTPFGFWQGYAGSGGWFTLACGNGGGAVTSVCR